MEYEYDDAEIKKQRVRTIAFTTAIAVIVLGIAIWAIIAIVGSRNTAEVADTTETAKVEATSKEKTVEEQPAPVTETVVKPAEPAKKPAAPAKETVPETGPEELLPLALVAGAAATYVSSKKLAVREA